MIQSQINIAKQQSQFHEPPHCKTCLRLKSFQVENGARLLEINICYETWGKLNIARDNAVLITHALTGSSHVTRGTANFQPGWWEFLIGPGKAIDTRKFFVICSNVLGGCSGSTGPASINPLTKKPYGVDFPVITIRDMVNAQERLIDHLGIQCLQSVCGASMGGMQAMEWAALYPDRVQSIISIAAPGRAYPQSIAFRKAQRKAIMMDPNWHEGHYYGRSVPTQGIELARMMGFITYRSEKEFAERFGRNTADDNLLNLHSRFEIEQYLEYHGKKLASWFDANTYLYLSKAMDMHDLGRGFSSYQQGLRRIRSDVLMIGFDSDQLFPAYQQKEIVDILRKSHFRTFYREISTLYGHDAFLIEEAQIAYHVREFLKHVRR